MSVSQPMMALFTPPNAAVTTSGLPAGAADAAATDPAAEFAALLAGQDPARIQAVLDQLGIAGKSGKGGLELAADGKQLPESIQDWFGQLASLESEQTTEQLVDTVAVEESLQGESEQWFRWLSESRLSLVDAPVEEAELDRAPGEPVTEEETDPALGLEPVSLGSVEPSTEADGLAPTSVDSDIPGLQSTIGTVTAVGSDGQADSAESAEQLSAVDDQRKSSPKLAADVVQLNQRNNAVASAPVESVAFAGKLAEQLDAGLKASASENESTDGSSRTGLGAQAASVAALTARPVAAPPQALGVPFGQQGWGEAMVEKVMWASSQNLRSVEIHLDPAELGPLEIHIQQRGQEQQIQFVSQNASVREALESQMYRLREMFTQQGMNQVNVSVGDSSAGQQSAREQSAGNRGGSGRADERGGSSVEAGDTILTSAAAARVSSERLVDYYA
ncbi:flagellar hook-length control protein FliK [Halopseudomonas nanhaiensis]|uniref:flagellar hook-length control protein FliK n=1 Tax=Halopseudomonas nanhaiensis TaxID=2830842 RepID=UPI001CC11014|nr:flagellar hook-length control protein FliK [Halopseudomonas nanhaiensis]UAW99254.1 flagellar hook-length control protein FliK [Halopseudomonas nanhaiensis]